jgi:hypothetical protein
MGNGHQKRDAEAVETKPYASPQLVEYGRVADLVAGGSGATVEEGDKSMTKFPA